MNRRAFLHSTGALTTLLACAGRSRPAKASPFGPLQPGWPLELPAGFRATVLDKAGDQMSDGYRVPARADGMACFPGPRGEHILLRNHEIGAMALLGAYPADQVPALAHTPDKFGGVSRLVVDPQTLRPLSSNLVLTGTENNCCGGPSPWGWISCEESSSPGHGYAFLCPADADSLRAPQPLRGLGRFHREAVAVLPDGQIIQTEDQMKGCLYRFVPEGERFTGRLEALAIPGRERLETAEYAVVGQRFEVSWVPVADPQAQTQLCHDQAQALGAAIFRRGEGIVREGDSVYFTATQGGHLGLGQVWRLDVRAGQLTLLAQSSDPEALDMPDNLTVAPWGDLILCEDGAEDDHLRGLTPTGELYTFARNTVSKMELAGVCFSPDGKVMYVNLQKDGMTLAITGPWPRR